MALRSELVTFCKTGGVGGVVLVILFYFNQDLTKTFEIIPFEIFVVTRTHALHQPTTCKGNVKTEIHFVYKSTFKSKNVQKKSKTLCFGQKPVWWTLKNWDNAHCFTFSRLSFLPTLFFHKIQFQIRCLSRNSFRFTYFNFMSMQIKHDIPVLEGKNLKS